MQRWQGAALAVALCSGCLEPLVDDDPGYSRYVLPPGSPVASGYADLQINRKIDLNDGVGAGVVPLKTGFADGKEVKYWDLGTAKRAAAPAYALARCGPDGTALPGSKLSQWPVIMETIPGDSDYSMYRAVSWVCLTDKYRDEVIPSSDALNDAVELGLVTDPRAADFWVNLPVVAQGVELAGTAGNRPPQRAFYKGKEILLHEFDDQEGRMPYKAGENIKVGNVYEIVKSGAMGVVRVIFSQPIERDGVRNPDYSPQWMFYTVTLKALVVSGMTTLEAEQAKENADIESWTQESDIVSVNPMTGAPTPKASRVLSVTASATTPRVNRPFVVQAVPQ
jgi:hypothetical protein